VTRRRCSSGGGGNSALQETQHVARFGTHVDRRQNTPRPLLPLLKLQLQLQLLLLLLLLLPPMLPSLLLLLTERASTWTATALYDCVCICVCLLGYSRVAAHHCGTCVRVYNTNLAAMELELVVQGWKDAELYN